ncbi:unnamed protein product [Gongylonema pulchrum]|uniref:ADP/ATP translocase n=1 Tax=Gongylonema pulchrum TaxID=637853 RepID=A0A183DBV8_9BILA|nr:unnamed protein product [Gongylonema pulchrum]
MYSGSGVNLLLITPEKSIKLVANDFFRYCLSKPNEADLPVFKGMIAGAGAGFCQITVTTPMELLKIQMQDAGRITGDNQPKKKLSAIGITIDLLKKRGILGLYKGYNSTMARDVTFSIMYFPFFAYLDSLGPRSADGSGDAVFYASFLAGLTSGAISAFAVTPFDGMFSNNNVILIILVDTHNSYRLFGRKKKTLRFMNIKLAGFFCG